MKGFLKNQRGGVTVFQCLLLSAMLAITGVFVDLARIMAAERKVESAINAALRSVLAGYAPELIGGYGIFGKDVREAGTLEREFLKYLEANLEEGDGLFNLLSFELAADGESTRVEGMEGLLSEEVYKRQVLEYMKYRAPIKAVPGMADWLVSSKLPEKALFSKEEKKVREKRRQLEKQVDSANGLVRSFNRYAYSSLEDLEAARARLDEMEGLAVSTRAFLTELKAVIGEADRTAEELMGREEGLLDPPLVVSREDYGPLEKEILDCLAVIRRNRDKIDGAIERLKGLNSSLSALEDRAEENRARIETLLKEEAAAGEEEKEAIRQQILGLKEALECDEEEIERVKAEIRAETGGLRLEEVPLIEFGEGGEKVVHDPEAETEAQKLLENLKEKLGAYLKTIDPSWLIGEEEFGERGKLTAGQAWDKPQPSRWESSEEEAEISNDEILSFMDRVFDGVKKVAEKGLEKSCLIEYITDRYTCVTSKEGKGHYFQRGEVEYILWGSPAELDNIVKTMGCIWFMRFAINTVDCFATSPVPEPMTRLIKALALGFTYSCQDMISLYRGEKISLCPSLKGAIKLDYKDHLKFLLAMAMLTEEGEQETLRSMCRLVQVNIKQGDPSFRLGSCVTALYGRAEVEIKLVFMPLFQLDRLGFSNFRKGKYRVIREAYLSY